VNLGDYKILNSQFDTTILQQNGTATFIQNVNSITMAVTSGQFGIFTSKQYHPYFNGKSQIVQITTFGLGAATNVEKSIGYISSNAVSPFNSTLDGFRLFKSTSDVYSVQIWRNGTQLITTSLLRANWLDPLDGMGASGATINFDNFNVFTFDFLYLGGTTLRCFVNINGKNILFARYFYANTDTEPFLHSPNKPIRWEIRSTTGSGNMGVICASVGSEGQTNKAGSDITILGNIAGFTAAAAGTKYAICGVKKLATFRDIFAVVSAFSGIVASNDNAAFQLVLNPTVANTFTYSTFAGTNFEVAVGTANNTVTGGIAFGNTFGRDKNIIASEIESLYARLNSKLTNEMDSIVLCAIPALGSSNVKVSGSMEVTWYQ